MGKGLQKIAKIVGIVAIGISVYGILFAVGAGATISTAMILGMKATTLLAIGITGLTIGTVPRSPSIESTGANARGIAYASADALGAYVFGTTTVPSAMVFEENHGTNDEKISNIFAHAWHEIESYQSLNVDAELVSFSGDAAIGDFSGILTWKRKLGAPAQTAIVLTDTDWPATTPKFDGVAHSGMVWDFKDQTKLRGGVPSKLDIKVQGAMLYDPRLDPAYGAGTQDFPDPTTWTFNNGNAVLVALRFLIGEYVSGGDLLWGRGAAETDIDMDTFVAMANVCDETVDSIPRFRLGGLHYLDGGWESFVQRWEQETGGKIYKSGGIYGIWVPHDDLTALTTITDADVIKGASIDHTVAGDIGNYFNTARGRYIEETEGYRAFPYPEVTESAPVADEGKRILYQDFSWIQDVSIAQRVARIKVRRSRFQRIWAVPLAWPGQGPNYAPFTVHNLNVKETNDTDQLVRVVDRRMSVSGATVLLLQEEVASIYDDTIALGTEFTSNLIPQRLDRLGTVVPRYIDGTILDDGTAHDTALVSGVVSGDLVDEVLSGSVDATRVRENIATGQQGYEDNERNVGDVAGGADGGTIRTATQLVDTVINFDGRNDRDGSAVTNPTVASDGTAIDHGTENTDGSVDISFEWVYGGSEADIDGFQVFIRRSSGPASYNMGTTPAEEEVTPVRADKRAFFTHGASDLYYTFGVRAYRIVDPDIDADREILGSIVQPSLTAEDPYLPSANVSFSGTVLGTIDPTTRIDGRYTSDLTDEVFSSGQLAIIRELIGQGVQGYINSSRFVVDIFGGADGGTQVIDFLTQTVKGQIELTNVQTFTPSSWTGFSTPPTGTVSYLDLGNFVILWPASGKSGTSNAVTFTMTGLPTAIRPASSSMIVGGLALQDNNLSNHGGVIIHSSGVVEFTFGEVIGADTRLNANGWTASGNKGWNRGAAIFYPT